MATKCPCFIIYNYHNLQHQHNVVLNNICNSKVFNKGFEQESQALTLSHRLSYDWMVEAVPQHWLYFLDQELQLLSGNVEYLI